MPAKQDECPADKMATVLAKVRKDERGAMRDIEGLLVEFPRDSRLHFLKSSLLAVQERYAEARDAMRHAIDIAPGFHVARFQLGFLHLTSGEPNAALEAWRPLQQLPVDHYLRLFVNGLTHMIRDELSLALAALRVGIKENHENEPMNCDMQIMIDRIEVSLAARGSIP
jgi:tetratricopeptide (TPR) repeat protein